MLLIGVELVKSSVERVIPRTCRVLSLALVAVLALSMVVKLWMAALNQKAPVTVLESETLHATPRIPERWSPPQAPCWHVSQVTHINLDHGLALPLAPILAGAALNLFKIR